MAGYVALRTQTVRCRDEDGREAFDAAGKALYRDVHRGEPIPEAVYWPNLVHYINGRYVCREQDFVPDPIVAPTPAPIEEPALPITAPLGEATALHVEQNAEMNRQLVDAQRAEAESREAAEREWAQGRPEPAAQAAPQAPAEPLPSPPAGGLPGRRARPR